MQSAIKTGVIGFGLAGKVFHSPFVHAVPGLELSYILQRTGDTAAQTWPQAKIVRNLDDLLASDVQLVVVGTPNSTHFPFAKQAILAGKHVVVDKPVTSTAAEAAELMELAAQQGVIYAPFHNRRFDGDFLTARSVIDSGELGRIASFESHFDRFRPALRVNSWKEDSGDHASLTMDLGPHLVDQALALFGKPISVTAMEWPARDGSAVEDAFDITLLFEQDGKRLPCYLRFTLLAAEPSPRFLIHGTRGSFRKYGVDQQEPVLLAGGVTVPSLPDESWLNEDESLWGTVAVAADPSQPNQLTRKSVPTLRGDYRQFYANVRDAILGKAELIVTPKDAWHTLRILELARQSSREQRTLPVTEKDW